MKRFLILFTILFGLVSQSFGATLSYPDYSKASLNTIVGVTDLAAAITSAGSSSKTIELTGPVTVSGNLTIPSNVALNAKKGGLITIAAGKTLTINGPFSAGDYQVFTGGGAVTFSSIKEVFPEWWGIDGTADEVEINKALNSVYAQNNRIWGDTAYDYSYGGATVRLKAKQYVTAASIVIPPHGILVGSGKRSTIISSSYDGQIIKNYDDPAVYDYKGIHLSSFGVKGDRTKTSQSGFDLLRLVSSDLVNISVENSGGVGVRLRQCVLNTISGLEVMSSISDGFVMQQGVNSWSDLTANGYPSNANTIINIHAKTNDAAGIRVTDSNGNVFIGGASENNYYTTADHATGYQIKLDGSSRQNRFNGIWCEGAGLSHFYQDTPSQTNSLSNFSHYSNGATGNVSRAVIVNRGTLYLNDPISQESDYRTISGSNAPFRVVKANVGKIVLSGAAQGGTQLQPLLVEDENGLTTGLNDYAVEEFSTGIGKTYHGPQTFYQAFGGNGFTVYVDDGAGAWDATALLQVQSFPLKGLSIYGKKLAYGTAAPVAGAWVVGDRVINSNPAVGQPKSWVCTVAGTPGTWVSEGNL